MELQVGRAVWTVAVPSERRVALQGPPRATPPATPAELMRQALEQPRDFVPLRRALTPDDRIAIVIDETLPALGEILEPLLEHLQSAGVARQAITLLVAPHASPDWEKALPPSCRDIRVERHVPTDRSRLAYLATTAGGRRLYLNRTLIDADFVIVLSTRRYDPTTGYSGAATAIFPALADAETRAAFAGQWHRQEGAAAWDALDREASEVVDLLGVPLFVQVIEGAGDAVQEIIAGLAATTPAGIERFKEHWQATVNEEADTVIAVLGGNPERIRFIDLATAAAGAARVCARGGRIALLTQAAPFLDSGAQLLRQLDGPDQAARQLAQHRPEDWVACRMWADVAQHYSLFLASGYPDAVAEELFATPLHDAVELQRLIDSGNRVLVIPDAHKMMVRYAAPTPIP